MHPPQRIDSDRFGYLMCHMASIQAATYVVGATLSLPAAATAVFLNSIALSVLLPLERKLEDKYQSPNIKFAVSEAWHGAASLSAAIATAILFGSSLPAIISISTACFIYTNAPTLFELSQKYIVKLNM